MRYILQSLLLLFFGSIHAQLTVDNTTMTPKQLTENVLVGVGVVPTGIIYNNSPAKANLINDQAAKWRTNADAGNLGLGSNKQGVLLTTGKATVALGPNNSDSATDPSTLQNPPIQGDPDLFILSGNKTVRNVSILEFDFVATGISVNFDYVFGSEEYPEYSFSSFNDAFGFFLSGPGISGGMGYTNDAKNIALLPNGTTVTINNVNQSTNQTYYVNNGDGSKPLINTYTQYDGFTTLLRATSQLQCGQTYHIKLAIGNVSDNGYDSGVFLKNFEIPPLDLKDNLGLSDNTSVCYGETVIITTGNQFPDDSVYKWFRDGVLLADNLPDLVVTTDGDYCVEVWTPAPGNCKIASDCIKIAYSPEVPFKNPVNMNVCTSLPPPYIFNINQTTYILNGLDPSDYIVSYYNSSYQDAYDGVPTGKIPNATLSTYSLTSASQTIWVRLEAQSGQACVVVKSFTLDAFQIPTAPIVSPVSYCQNAVAVPLTATGSNLLWYANATGGTGNVVAPTPSTTSAGNTTYYVSQTTNGCEGPRASLVVTVNALPLAPVVATPVTYCQNTPATPLTATGSNLLWYTVSTGGTGSATAPTPNTTVIGDTNYYVSQTVNGCEGTRALLVVTIIATPSAPTVVTPVIYCQYATATPLTATGSNLLWYTTATGGTGSATAPTPSTLVVGDTNYYVSQSIIGCEAPRALIIVTILPSPNAPTVTSPINYCQNATASPLTATGTNLLWYTVATGGVGSGTAPTPNTSIPGDTTYYVSQTVNGCGGPRASVFVSVIAPPIAPAVSSPVGYCQNATAAPLTATGTNLLWYTVATGGTGSATAPTPSTAVVGSTNYYVSQTVSGCEGPRALIVVTVSASPLAPTVTTPVTYCQNTSASALTATGTSLLWYTVAAGGTGSATAPIPGTTTAGNTTFYVSQTVNGCEGPRASILVTVIPTPSTPIVITPINYCLNTVAVPLTATGTNLLWYTVATGGVGSGTAPTPNTSIPGDTTYYVSQTVNGCEGPRASIFVSVIAPPIAPTVSSPVGYCQNTTAAPLTATGTSLLWYTVATGGTGSATAPTPSTAVVGSTNYYVSQTVSGCEGPRALIVVTVSASPLAPTVTTPVTYCQNASASALTATGTSLLWYTVGTGGTGSATAPIPGTTTAGNTTFYVSQTVNGCEGPRASILVTVIPTPSTPIVITPINYCLNTVAVPLTATGTNLLWYTVATGGVGSGTAPTPSTSIPGDTTYYVSQTVNGCEGPRASIFVSVIAPPIAPTVTSPVGYCQNTTAAPLTATGTNLLWYTVAIGGTASTIAPTPSTAVVGSTNYYVSQTVSGCEGPRALIAVTVSASPLAPIVTTPVTYCQNASASALTATGASLLWYTVATGGTGSATAPIPSAATPGNTSYYVAQTVNNCESPRSLIVVKINPTPLPSLDQNGFLCVDGETGVVTSTYTLNSGLSNTLYNFEWYEIVSGVYTIIPSETTNSYVVKIPGTYGVIATNKSTFCVSDLVTASVVASSPPVSIDIVSSDYFAEYQTITVNSLPAGNYLYQIDNGAFQTSNIFNNVSSGEHKIVVKDSKGCGQIVGFVNTIDYPKFFTPNGDGYNDTWNISTLSNQPNAKISIFDRYGKLIKQISPAGQGWDGLFNGKGLPSTDYWFFVDYKESGVDKVFRAHFTLKR